MSNTKSSSCQKSSVAKRTAKYAPIAQMASDEPAASTKEGEHRPKDMNMALNLKTSDGPNDVVEELSSNDDETESEKYMIRMQNKKLRFQIFLLVTD